MLVAAIALAVSGAVAAQDIEPVDTIRVKAESFVKSQMPREANVASVTAGTLDSRLRLARCTSGMHAQIPTGMSMQARTMVGVACDGPVRWMVYVPVTVESRKVTGLSTAYLTSENDLLARTVQRPLPMGTTLTMDMFKPDLVIKHGQEVTLVAAAGGIEVRATGRALADAAGGTRLKVQNLSSLKVVEGVVEGPDVVRVSE